MGLYILKYPYRKVLLPLAKRISWIHPDMIGYAATLLAVVTAYLYYLSGKYPSALIAAIITIFIRMTFNTIDGVIAIQRGNLRLRGEIVNALPDRYSDIILMVGLFFSPYCGAIFAFTGIASMFLVSYTGMLGKALGVEWQHHGPLGKVERLLLIMIATLAQYVAIKQGAPRFAAAGISLTWLEWAMVLFLILGQLTVYNRLRGMLRQIRKKEWLLHDRERLSGKKILVVYDSLTSNTERVARSAGEALGADVIKADHAPGPEKYDWIILATPDIRAQATSSIQKYCADHRTGIGRYGIIVTYGMPVWGPLSARTCFKNIGTAVGKKAAAVFSCKGFHRKYKTYKGHPDETDLFNAFLFGVTFGRKCLKNG